MNKEARTFIFGLLLLIVCGIGFAIQITQLRIGMHYNFGDWLLFILNLYGSIISIFTIYKTID